jgi:hypothetical protein
MNEPIKPIKRRSMGMGQSGLKYDKVADFQGGTRENPYILGDYGRNIYSKGERIGYALDIRICGYRGLPVNLIQTLVFEVDGVLLPDAVKYIQYENREYPFDDIGTDKIENYWFWKYGDYLRVFFKIDGGIPQGIHDVTFGLSLRDHYSSTSVCTKKVTIV